MAGSGPAVLPLAQCSTLASGAVSHGDGAAGLRFDCGKTLPLDAVQTPATTGHSLPSQFE